MGDSKVDVVDGAGKVIRGRAIRAQDHEVVDLFVVEADLITDPVVEGRHSRPRHRHADRGHLPGIDPGASLIGIHPEPAIVRRGPPGRLGLLAKLVQLVCGCKAVVGEATVEQIQRHLPITLVAHALAIRRVRATDIDPFIPVKAEPPHRGHNVLAVLGRVALRVGVVRT